MAYWLPKSEPDDWSWTAQVAKGREGAEWTGIRNHSAQSHLRAMKKGELAFFYHTGKERAIVGIVKVIAEAHPDSTDQAWQSIEAAAVEPLPTPVTLDRIKADKRFATMALARLPRLSVQPVAATEWQLIRKMGGLDRGRPGQTSGQARPPAGDRRRKFDTPTHRVSTGRAALIPRHGSSSPLALELHEHRPRCDPGTASGTWLLGSRARPGGMTSWRRLGRAPKPTPSPADPQLRRARPLR